MRWLVATVAETIPETVAAVTLRLEVPDWGGHRAGQHVDVRLTAEDGYSAQRSYSIASPPGADLVELTIVRFGDGEVSPYLTTVLDVGDQLEVRGPLGGYFVWEPEDRGPALLVGGGSGVVPLMAMLRHHRALDHRGAMRLLYSARTPEDVLYGDELNELTDGHRAVTITLTGAPPPNWAGRRGRVDAALLAEVGWPPAVGPRCFVCGPTPFVEATADALAQSPRVAAADDTASAQSRTPGRSIHPSRQQSAALWKTSRCTDGSTLLQADSKAGVMRWRTSARRPSPEAVQRSWKASDPALSGDGAFVL